MAAEPATVAGGTTTDGKVDILLVDDDANKRYSMKTILAPLGQVVVEAASGVDALRQLLKQDFAVILLDVRMPEMNGFELAQLIRQRPRSERTPIIFVTALDHAEIDMSRGYAIGAVDFLFAPVAPAIVRAKVGVFVELYKAQQELRRYRTQLERLVQERTTALTAINRELEAFSYSVSHDLAAPLRAFDGLNESLLADYGDQLEPRVKDYLQRMRRASDSMTSVFDGLQALFRLTSGEIQREPCDLSAMASEIIEELRTANPDRKVGVEIIPGLTASADPRLARILLANLIGNSWKFTGNEPAARVEIGSENVDGDTRLFVRDNGVGFDMIHAHKLFGAFQRLHSQSQFPGVGIGLAAVRRIINRHGGRVWAEAAVGEGATFYFVL
jgi:signal transduction histidine kinase